MRSDEERAAYLAAKRELAKPIARPSTLFDDNGEELVRRSILVRFVQRLEPWSDGEGGNLWQ